MSDFKGVSLHLLIKAVAMQMAIPALMRGQETPLSEIEDIILNRLKQILSALPTEIYQLDHGEKYSPEIIPVLIFYGNLVKVIHDPRISGYIDQKCSVSSSKSFVMTNRGIVQATIEALEDAIRMHSKNRFKGKRLFRKELLSVLLEHGLSSVVDLIKHELVNSPKDVPDTDRAIQRVHAEKVNLKKIRKHGISGAFKNKS